MIHTYTTRGWRAEKIPPHLPSCFLAKINMASPALSHLSLEQWLCRKQKSICPNWGTKSFQKRLSWALRQESRSRDHAPDVLLFGQEHYLKKRKIHSHRDRASWLGSTGRSLTRGWAHLLYHTPLLPSEGEILPCPALIIEGPARAEPHH